MMPPPAYRLRFARIAGFLALCLAGLSACGSESPRLDVSSDVERCKEHLLAIHEGLVAYGNQSGGRAPQTSGVALLGELLTSGIWPDDAEHRARLTCPGPHAEPVPPNTAYHRLEELNGTHSAYAVRDTRSHPLASYPLGGRELQAVVACDNAGGRPNHEGMTNVLFSDGSIRTYVLDELIASGTLSADSTTLEVGPESPLDVLRTLTRE